MEFINVIGGGLAGVEAAWQAAEAGGRVIIHEMRPAKMTEAHKTDGLAELVQRAGVPDGVFNVLQGDATAVNGRSAFGRSPVINVPRAWARCEFRMRTGMLRDTAGWIVAGCNTFAPK